MNNLNFKDNVSSQRAVNYTVFVTIQINKYLGHIVNVDGGWSKLNCS